MLIIDPAMPKKKTNYYRALANACTRIGLPVTTPHEFRHSFSTWLDENGCPRSVRLALLGQSRRAVQDRYNHASPEAMREWLGKFYSAAQLPVTRELAPKRPQLGTQTPSAGESNGRATLKVEDVKQIRARAAEGPSVLAREFGVDRRTISKIINRETWKNVA